MASLPAAAFIAAILVLVPLPSHWRARNVATLSLITWLFVINIIYGVNTVVWAHSVENIIPVWCDITTKIIIGASTALPAATMCVCKHLEAVASSRVVRVLPSMKRRRMIFELVMCFGVPMVIMALHYVVQGHRFDIVEEFGCEPATYYSIPAVFVVWFLPLLFATITMIYAAIALYHFIRKRMSFAAHLANSQSSLTTHRYFRLMAMAISEIFWGTSLTAYALYANVAPGLYPYLNWTFVHVDFSRVDQFPLVLIPPSYLKQLLLLWWAMPVSGYIFFLFFGFGSETMQDYRRAYDFVLRKVFRRTPADHATLAGPLPIAYRRRPSRSATSMLSVDIMSDIKNVQALPIYSPPVDGTFLPSPPTKVKTKTASMIISTDMFLQDRVMPSPAFTPTTATPSESTHYIEISESYPPSRPPSLPSSPRAVHEIAPPQAAYQGPFSAPTVCPVSAYGVPGHAEPFVVMVDTQVAHIV